MSDQTGRPTIYTPELAEAICKNLELAMPLSLAAEAEGVNRKTAYSWENDDYGAHLHPDGLGFSALVARARARAARMLTEKAIDAGKGSSQATWLLERRFRDDYAPPKKEGEGAAVNEVHIRIEGGLAHSVDQAAAAKGTENAGQTLGGPSA